MPSKFYCHCLNILQVTEGRGGGSVCPLLPEGPRTRRAGFHFRRSRNQKRGAIRSSENQTDGVGSRTPILPMTPSLTI